MTIPNDRITSNVPNGEDGTKPEDINPGGQQFIVKVPKKPEDPKPSVTIVVSENIPVLVEKIVFPPSTTNVEKVTIKVPSDEVKPSSQATTTTTPSTGTTPSATDKFVTIVDNEPVNELGEIFFPNSPKITKFVVIIESPKTPEEGTSPTVYEIEIKVHACINGRSKHDICIVFSNVP